MMFGLDVPFVKFGSTPGVGQPTASNEGTCGNSFALQQMLADLGYSPGSIDGAIGSGTMAALKKFSQATGVTYSPGTFPKAATCQGVMDAWAAAHAPAPVSAPVYTQPAPTKTAVKIDLGAGFSACMREELASHKAGGPYNPARCTAILSPATKVMSAQAPAVTSSWWASSPTSQKVAVVGGAIVVAGGVAYLVTRNRSATPNRRRRTRRS